MYDAKVYNDKIPTIVRNPMLEFTGSDCLLVNRRKRGATSKGAYSNCHSNVQDWVDKIGGARISGWLLARIPKFLNEGVWAWIFHSIWLTPEGKLTDVTMDDDYAGKDFVTFWHDKYRSCDLINGTSYNNIVVFQSDATALMCSRRYDYSAEKGKLYWTLNKLNEIRSLDQHVGISRYLNSQYTENIKHLKEKYNAVTDGTKLHFNENSIQSRQNLLFDFFVTR